MRVAIIADIHGNATALNAVLAAADEVDMVWNLGDIVGYGPDPAECIDLLLPTPHLCVAGNHDVLVTGKADPALFNPDALTVCDWTRAVLEDDFIGHHMDYLNSLPFSLEPVEDIFLVHGAPDYKNSNTVLWEYVTSTWQAHDILSAIPHKVVFVGHTHTPLVFSKASGEETEFVEMEAGDSIKLDMASRKYLINPGSVGQPRDGNPKASFMLFDTDTNFLEVGRVDYDIDEVSERIIASGLPVSLSERLKKGL